MARRSRSVSVEESPLRRARKARNWTLEQVVEELDRRADGGHCGVTASMLSAWELGSTTSMRHRKELCDLYGQGPDVLFAHQDAELRLSTPKLLAGFAELQHAMLETVAGARECLVVMGSRSRDRVYLSAIEDRLERHPALVYYRVLYGPPHHRMLKEHLRRLVSLRDPDDRSLGVKTLHLGVVEDPVAPERFFCASENGAVVPIPSLTSHEAFDSGIALGATEAGRLLDHGRQAYAASTRIESAAAIEGLKVLRMRGATQ